MLSVTLPSNPNPLESRLILRFHVPGIAKPGGSKKSFYIKSLKRSVITEASNNKEWKQSVKLFGRQAYSGPLIDYAIRVDFAFIRKRPKWHYGTGKNSSALKPSAPKYPTSKPDVTKLVRAAEDALTSIVWTDDNIIVDQFNSKRYGDNPGVVISIYRME